mgnify:CR=1 FL=1
MKIVGGFFMEYFVYILYSQSKGRYYVGSTGNLEDRMTRHKQGRSKATKAGRPWQLVFKKQFQDRSSAYQYEMYIKKQKSSRYIEQLICGPENEQSSVV